MEDIRILWKVRHRETGLFRGVWLGRFEFATHLNEVGNVYKTLKGAIASTKRDLTMSKQQISDCNLLDVFAPNSYGSYTISCESDSEMFDIVKVEVKEGMKFRDSKNNEYKILHFCNGRVDFSTPNNEHEIIVYENIYDGVKGFIGYDAFFSQDRLQDLKFRICDEEYIVEDI